METDLFKWATCDYVSELVIQFYDVELLVDIVDLKIGQKCLSVCINYDKGWVELVLPNSQVKKFKLGLKVLA